MDPIARRILVVEDEPLIQMLAVDNLEELGFSAEVASSASAARAKLAELGGAVSAMIVDIGLPDAKGDALVEELRASWPKLRVVIATGYDETELRERFADPATTAFLRKPYTMDQMRAALDAIGA